MFDGISAALRNATMDACRQAADNCSPAVLYALFAGIVITTVALFAMWRAGTFNYKDVA